MEKYNRNLIPAIAILSMALPLLPVSSLAQTIEEKEKQVESESSEPTDPNEKPSKIEATHKALTQTILQTSNRIDSFFGDERFQAESRQTELTVSLTLKAEQAETLKISGSAKLKLVLPNLEDRYQIIIERAQSEDQDIEDLIEGNAPAVSEEDETVDWTSAFRFMVKTKKDLNISIDAGIKFRIPPIPFVKTRYRTSHEWKLWAIRFTQTLAIYQDSGWEETSRIDFDRTVGPKNLFRSSTSGSWFEEERGYFVTQAFSLSESLGRNQVLRYEWNTQMRTGEDEDDAPEDLTSDFRVIETYVGLKYRRTLFWPWLFGELTPGVAYPRDRDYQSTVRVRFKIEVQFREVK